MSSLLERVSENERIKELEALLEASNSRSALKYKVSEKGALSVYGLGRFPTTLYLEQWQRFLSDANLSAIKSFIQSNSHLMTRKGDRLV